jgi:hypothetical protein
MNVAYADIVVESQQVEISLSINLFEMDLLLSLDQNGDAVVDQDELDVRSSVILDYLRRRIAVSAEGVALPLEVGPFRVGRGLDSKDVFESTLRFRAQKPIADLAIRCEPLTDLGPDHKTLAKISRNGDVEQFVFEKGVTYQRATADFVGYLVQFLKLGIVHIFTGYDHILFLLGLLLVGGSFLAVVKIVTSFTLAHSLTLSLAALGIVNMPARLIEAGIAFSIIYIALENLLFKEFNRRWVVSFLFGLVHGFGFANVLKEMHLPRAALISSLFSFNAGVEVGQIAVVLLILPVLGMVRRSKAHGAVVTSASCVILVAGLIWFYQRAFLRK